MCTSLEVKGCILAKKLRVPEERPSALSARWKSKHSSVTWKDFLLEKLIKPSKDNILLVSFLSWRTAHPRFSAKRALGISQKATLPSSLASKSLSDAVRGGDTPGGGK
jgi:hypothetical protein